MKALSKVFSRRNSLGQYEATCPNQSKDLLSCTSASFRFGEIFLAPYMQQEEVIASLFMKMFLYKY